MEDEHRLMQAEPGLSGEVGTHQAFPLRTGLARRAYPAQQDFGPISLIGPKGKGKLSEFPGVSRVACMFGAQTPRERQHLFVFCGKKCHSHMDCKQEVPFAYEL